jgi:hypothetical protein
MSTNFIPSHAECPSCSGCSPHSNLRHTDIEAADLGKSGLHAHGSTCPLVDPAGNGPLRGGRFALASLGLFLVPLLLATIGAIVGMGTGEMGTGGTDNPNGQFLGASGGLLIGMVGSIVVTRVLRARSHEFKPLEIKSLEISKGETP